MGVISTDSIGIGVSFGPIPSKLTIAEPLVLIGHMTADNTPVLHTVKVRVTELSQLLVLHQILANAYFDNTVIQ